MKIQQEKYKILLFGDSVLYGGTYVDNKDILSHKLCKKLKEIKIKKQSVETLEQMLMVLLI